MIDKLQAENVELRLKNETLIWAIAEIRAIKVGESKGYKPKSCVGCGQMFIPQGGRQRWCKRCHPDVD